MKGKRSNNFGKSKTFMISAIIIIILCAVSSYFLNKWYKHQLTLPKEEPPPPAS